jgi:hypothetical protein
VPELPALPEVPGFLALPEEPMQPAARQSMMTVIVTSTIEQNPDGIRHVPEFPTIDFSCSGQLLFNDIKRRVSDFRNA